MVDGLGGKSWVGEGREGLMWGSRSTTVRREERKPIEYDYSPVVSLIVPLPQLLASWAVQEISRVWTWMTPGHGWDLER